MGYESESDDENDDNFEFAIPPEPELHVVNEDENDHPDEDLEAEMDDETEELGAHGVGVEDEGVIEETFEAGRLKDDNEDIDQPEIDHMPENTNHIPLN